MIKFIYLLKEKPKQKEKKNLVWLHLVINYYDLVVDDDELFFLSFCKLLTSANEKTKWTNDYLDQWNIEKYLLVSLEDLSDRLKIFIVDEIVYILQFEFYSCINSNYTIISQRIKIIVYWIYIKKM